MIGITRRRAGYLLSANGPIQQKLGRQSLPHDPERPPMPPTLGTGISGQTTNNGRVFIALKPWDQREGGVVQEFIARIRPKLAKVEGGQFFMQAIQDVRVGARDFQDRVPVYAAGRGPGRALRLGAQGAGPSCRACRCCAMWPPTSRSAARPRH